MEVDLPEFYGSGLAEGQTMTCRRIHQPIGEDGMITCSKELEAIDSHADVTVVFSSMPF